MLSTLRVLQKYLEEVKSREEWVQHRRYRIVHHPWNNFYSAFINRVWYPITGSSPTVNAELFFEEVLTCTLPADAHFFLFGMKSHDSEIRLTKFFLHEMKNHQVFFDIGAHIGFYSLMANKLMKPDSRIFSFEASANTYRFLAKNTSEKNKIEIVHAAVCNQNGNIDFTELPQRYAEDNSIHIQRTDLPKVKVSSLRLDDFCSQKNVFPDLIKLDVEGAELEALQGMKSILTQHSPVLVMECWSNNSEKMKTHQQALQLLLDFGYKQFVIDDDGKLFETADDQMMINKNNIESDNLVYRKP